MAVHSQKLTAKAIQMRELVAQFERSGESVAEFAHRHGVMSDTLRWWRRRFGSEQKSAAKVELIEIGAPEQKCELELRLANGMSVKVPAGFDASALERLLTVLAKC